MKKHKHRQNFFIKIEFNVSHILIPIRRCDTFIALYTNIVVFVPVQEGILFDKSRS